MSRFLCLTYLIYDEFGVSSCGFDLDDDRSSITPMARETMICASRGWYKLTSHGPSDLSVVAWSFRSFLYICYIFITLGRLPRKCMNHIYRPVKIYPLHFIAREGISREYPVFSAGGNISPTYRPNAPQAFCRDDASSKNLTVSRIFV